MNLTLNPLTEPPDDGREVMVHSRGNLFPVPAVWSAERKEFLAFGLYSIENAIGWQEIGIANCGG